ncbi:uncharacterized protein EAF02_003479 [Botrytis sinoallii]|uniref:uncharacterized protein n=1 Tax=Botrytis sinoallii TaxID=1463999 RepID=UPI0019023C12|nr:uncharacterized protein EAF02_003479 [Botrytis sinoallii]KAF7886832.1 hypothetical protein EAF02_003479 [Botrytis sinoallii]
MKEALEMLRIPREDLPELFKGNGKFRCNTASAVSSMEQLPTPRYRFVTTKSTALLSKFPKKLFYRDRIKNTSNSDSPSSLTPHRATSQSHMSSIHQKSSPKTRCLMVGKFFLCIEICLLTCQERSSFTTAVRSLARCCGYLEAEIISGEVSVDIHGTVLNKIDQQDDEKIEQPIGSNLAGVFPLRLLGEIADDAVVKSIYVDRAL